MDSLEKKTVSLKCGFVIKLLSVIALVCAAIVPVLSVISGASVSIIGLIMLLLRVAPCVLFALYIFKYHNKLKAAVLLPVIFGCIAFESLLNLLMFSNIYELIITLIRLYAFLLAMISAFTGFDKKIYIIITMSALILFKVLEFIGLMYPLRLNYIREIFLNVALLLFVANNRMPPIISASAKNKSAEKMNPEQSLRALQNKLDFGIITEEEYQTQRAEIISKL